MKVGDRVRYRNAPVEGGYHSPAWVGWEGTLTHMPSGNSSTATVEFDGRGTHWPFLQNLELIEMPTINTAEPLQMRGTIGGDRDVTFVTVTSDNNILVTEVGKSGWIIFDQMGKFVRSEGGGGSALVLKNKIRTRSSYTVIDHMGAHWSGYFNRQTAWDRHPNANHMIQIDTRDGVVVGVGTLKRPA